MPKKFKELTPPTGFSRLLFRFPIALYRLGLGGLFGKRFLLLNHTGRKSGLVRQVVLEVVDYNPVTQVCVVCVGFGPKSQWYQNLKHDPNASIVLGQKKLKVHAEELAKQEGGQLFFDFVKRNPGEAGFIKILGYEVDGTDADWIAVGEDLTFIRFVPVENPAS